jgi:hypothetical protein
MIVTAKIMVSELGGKARPAYQKQNLTLAKVTL